jgi:hypothetical protein
MQIIISLAMPRQQVVYAMRAKTKFAGTKNYGFE